jgi:hypothetical protein
VLLQGCRNGLQAEVLLALAHGAKQADRLDC